MRDFARDFYLSPAWRHCRDAYVAKAGGLCERCLAKGLYVPGEIVHHKVHLTPDNITDYEISLNDENLELLCRACHADEHQRLKKRYKVLEDGRIAPIR